jgi:hypothetical protein
MNVIQFGDAACGKVRGYLDSYLGNELLVETNHEVLRHLESCPQCAAELNTRARVRTGLQAAVRGTPVPDGLEARVQRVVRAQSRRTRAGLYTMAVAAMVIIGLAIVSLTRAKPGPEEAILSKASGRLALVLNVGLRDHLHCAVFRKYDKAAVQLSPEIAELARLVKARLPGDFRIIQGHHCTAAGRQYVHLIVTRGDKLLSLLLTRKRSGESLSGGVYQEGVDRFQVMGFESHDYLVYVISDLDAQQNLQLATNIAPAVREYLAAHAG